MVRLNAANLAKTTLQSSITNSATSITVSSSTGFPLPPFRVTLFDASNSEIIEVTAVNGTTWTVTRAQEGTTARAWNAGTAIELRWTAGMYDELKNTANLIDPVSVVLDDGSFQVTNLLGTYGSFSVDSNGDGVPDGWTTSGGTETTIQTLNGQVYMKVENPSSSSSRGIYRNVSTVQNNVHFVRAWRNAKLISGTYLGDQSGLYLYYFNPNVVNFTNFGESTAYAVCTANNTYVAFYVRCPGWTLAGTYTVETYYDNVICTDITTMGELPSNIKSYFNNTVTYWSDLGTTNYISNAYGTSKRGVDWLNELIPYGENTYTVYYKLYRDRIVSSLEQTPIQLGVNNNFGFLNVTGKVLKLQGVVNLPGLAQSARCTNANIALSNVTESVILVSASSSAITVTLPKAVDNAGRVLYIKKIDSSANAVTINAQSGETIEGQSSASLTSQYQTLRLIAYGSVWYKI